MFLLTFYCCNIKNCFSVCGMTCCHRWRGKVAAAPLRTAMKWSFQNWMDFRRCCSGDCLVVRSGKSCRRHVLPFYIYVMLHCLKFYVLALIRRDGYAWGHARRKWLSRLRLGSSLVLSMLSWSRSWGGSSGTCCHGWMCAEVFWSDRCIEYVTCCGWWWQCCVGTVQVSHLHIFLPLPLPLQVWWIWTPGAGFVCGLFWFLRTQGRIVFTF